MTDYRGRWDLAKERILCSWRRHRLYASGHVIGCSTCHKQLGGSDYHATFLWYEGGRSIRWGRDEIAALKLFWHQFTDAPTETYYAWEEHSRVEDL